MIVAGLVRHFCYMRYIFQRLQKQISRFGRVLILFARKESHQIESILSFLNYLFSNTSENMPETTINRFPFVLKRSVLIICFWSFV